MRSLKLNVLVDLPFSSAYYSYQADMDGDGNDEFLFYSPTEEKLVVYNEDFQLVSESKVKMPDSLWNIFQYASKNQEHKLFVESGRSGYFISLKRNIYYYLGYHDIPRNILSVSPFYCFN